MGGENLETSKFLVANWMMPPFIDVGIKGRGTNGWKMISLRFGCAEIEILT